MSQTPFQRALDWFQKTIFGEEPISAPKPQAKSSLPSPLRAARAIAQTGSGPWLSREAVFLRQAKLLVNYEDDVPWERSITYYYPTYQSLSDDELRAYFSWRTHLRRGDLHRACPTFVFLYIYELLNQIDVRDPLDGYWKLKGFHAAYTQLDSTIDPYLDRWLTDYVIYYELSPMLLADLPELRRDEAISVLEGISEQPDDRLIEAVHLLAPRWLGRSRYYSEAKADCDRVICNVLRKMDLHYAKCKRGMVEQFFGAIEERTVRLFDSAVFCRKTAGRDRSFILSESRSYHYTNGIWTLRCYRNENHCSKLESILKAIDGIMRQRFDYRHKIRVDLETKWLLKLIQEECDILQEEKKKSEAPVLPIDFSRLDQIRREAAVTRDKLIVDEEELPQEQPPVPDPAPEPPAAPSENTPLSPQEYRLLQCLLYERPTDWVQSSGLLFSVLVDSINEKLYDTFCDSVLEDTAVIEDYTEDLKEMIHP